MLRSKWCSNPSSAVLALKTFLEDVAIDTEQKIWEKKVFRKKRFEKIEIDDKKGERFSEREGNLLKMKIFFSLKKI